MTEPTHPQTTQLWCIRYAGTDDLAAAETREAAEKMAVEHREAVKRVIAANTDSAAHGITEQSMEVTVELWPWSAEAHAKDLKRDN